MNKNFLINFRTCKDIFIYSKKNRANFKSILFVILFVLISFFVSLIILSLLQYDFGRAIKHIFTIPFNKSVSKDFAVQIATYGMASLSFLFAYKSGLFNIGITGQMIGAGLAIVGVGIQVGQNVGQGAVVLTLIIAILTGAFISLISGVLKVLFNIHEVVSGIMLNWIIFFLSKSLMGANGALNNDGLISTQIPQGMSIYDQTVSSSFVGAIIIFFICVALVWFVLKFTVFGKKIKSVGLSKDASVYSGYNAKLLQLSSFAISGAIAGLLAVIVYAGSGDRAIPFPQSDNLPAYGFDGIAISLISFSNPLALVPVSVFLSIIKTSSAASPPFPNSFGDLLLGIIMYGVAIFVLVYKYKPIAWIKKKLSKKPKYQNSYYINKYTENHIKYLNHIEKLLSDRNIDLFLKNKEIDKNLSLIEKIKKRRINKVEVNTIYLNNKKSLYESYKMNFKTIGSENEIDLIGGK